MKLQPNVFCMPTECSNCKSRGFAGVNFQFETIIILNEFEIDKLKIIGQTYVSVIKQVVGTDK